jgi:hypothetical protein
MEVIQDVKSQIENLIILNASAANKITMSKTFNNIKNKIETIAPLIFTQEYPYHFLSLTVSGSDICVGKAELFKGTTLKLSDINNNFIELYNSITSNKNLNEDEDEKSDDDD